MSKLTKKDDEIQVKIYGDEFQRDLAVVKTIPGRTFDGETKIWTVPATAENAEKLMLAMRPEADAEILAWVKSHKQKKTDELVTPLPDDAQLLVPWADKLYAYQRAFVDWAVDHPRAINADDMGLGKTFQAISAVAEYTLHSVCDGDNKGTAQGAQPGVQQALSSATPRKGARSDSTAYAEVSRRDPEADFGSEGSAVSGLRDHAAAAGDGPGPCSGSEAVRSGALGGLPASGGADSPGSDLGGVGEVRRSMPQLSSDEALAILRDFSGPKLVICPASVKGVWKRELLKWLGDKTPVVVLEGSYSPRKATLAECEMLGIAVEDKAKMPRLTATQVKSVIIQEAAARNAWVIANWEQIRVHTLEREKVITVKLPTGVERKEKRKEKYDALRQPEFGTIPWQAVIADEAHRAKSRKSLQTRGLWLIDAPMKLALTGTPVMNSPDELWPILRWLYPEEFGKSLPPSKKHPHGVPKLAYWPFFDTYVDSYESHYGKVITGVRNADALRFLLSKKLVRRTKGDKLDLPPKVREVIPIELTKKQRKLYDEAEKAMWLTVKKSIEEGDKQLAKAAAAIAEGKASIYDMPNGAVRTTRLRQICSTPALLEGDDESAKLDAAVEIITDAQPKQFVVFSEFVGTCHALAERLEKKGLKVGVWTGEVSTEDRTEMEDEFQAGALDVLVGTIAAMGQGVTLTAADTAIFIERHWTPAMNEQAEDRLWRNGQENHVTILILEGIDTVDSSKVNPTNEIKSMIVRAVVQQDAVETRTKEAV